MWRFQRQLGGGGATQKIRGIQAQLRSKKREGKVGGGVADFAFRDRERKGIPLEEGEIGFLRCMCESGGSIG